MMEDKLPKNWTETTLGEIADWGSGGTPKRGNKDYYGGNIPWIKTGDLNNGVIEAASEYITELGLRNSSAKLFPKDSVGIAMYGATIGKTAIFGIEAATNQACAVGQPLGEIPNTFLHYFLKSQKQNFIDKGKGGAQPNISQTVIKAHQVSLPPLTEQKRIVAKLDKLFGHLEVLKTKLARIPSLLSDFRQSVLTQAVTGERNEFQTFGDLELKIQTGPFGSALHKHDYIKDGISVINPSHIKNGKIYPSSTVSINNEKFKELVRWKLDDGDVIIGRRGEMGRAAVYRDTYGTLICGTGSIVFKTKPKLDSNFLSMYLRSPFVVNFLTENSIGSTMINLNQKIIKSLPFPKVNLQEQKKIVRRVETLLAKADKIEKRYQALKAKIETLPQAILAKAFRGELVEQLETDGDAKELLREIAALRAEMDSKKKKKRKKK